MSKPERDDKSKGNNSKITIRKRSLVLSLVIVLSLSVFLIVSGPLSSSLLSLYPIKLNPARAQQQPSSRPQQPSSQPQQQQSSSTTSGTSPKSSAAPTSPFSPSPSSSAPISQSSPKSPSAFPSSSTSAPSQSSSLSPSTTTSSTSAPELPSPLSGAIRQTKEKIDIFCQQQPALCAFGPIALDIASFTLACSGAEINLLACVKAIAQVGKDIIKGPQCPPNSTPKLNVGGPGLCQCKHGFTNCAAPDADFPICLQTDTATSCGTCGNLVDCNAKLGTGGVCNSGVCQCATGLVLKDGKCAPACGTTQQLCGNNICCPTGQICQGNGACGFCGAGTSVNPSTGECQCTDPTQGLVQVNGHQECRACNSNEILQNGACVACPSDKPTACNDECLDLSSPTSCGTSCNDLKTCAAPTGGTATCNNGQCGQTCPADKPDVCGNVCVNTHDADPANCNGCGVDNPGFICKSGDKCETGPDPGHPGGQITECKTDSCMVPPGDRTSCGGSDCCYFTSQDHSTATCLVPTGPGAICNPARQDCILATGNINTPYCPT